jgi:hypothetical protein
VDLLWLRLMGEAMQKRCVRTSRTISLICLQGLRGSYGIVGRSTPIMMTIVNNSRWNPFRRYALGSMAEDTDATAPPLASTKSKTWETTIERVESWPEEARPLKKHNWLSYVYGIGDLILVLLPIYFIREFADAVAVVLA